MTPASTASTSLSCQTCLPKKGVGVPGMFPLRGHDRMCDPPLPLYHSPAASANALVQIKGGEKSPKSCNNNGPSQHKAFCQPRGTTASQSPAPRRARIALRFLAASPIRAAPSAGGRRSPRCRNPAPRLLLPALLQGGLKIETVLIRGSEGERGWLLLGYDTPHYVATALPEDPLLHLGYRARALRKDAN